LGRATILVLTTLPDREIAEAIGRELLSARLAACVHVGSSLRSLYHWRGEIETADEIPLSIKTQAGLYPQVEQAIRARHPYDVPEIISVPIERGLPAYLEWITTETGDDHA